MTLCIRQLPSQPASHLGPLSVRQRNAIRMAFRWQTDSGPTGLLVLLFVGAYDIVCGLIVWLFHAPLSFGMVSTGLQIREHIWKSFFLFLNQNICCGYSKEPSQWDGSFEHPKHMFKLMDKDRNAILGGSLSGPICLAVIVAFPGLLSSQAEL